MSPFLGGAEERVARGRELPAPEVEIGTTVAFLPASSEVTGSMWMTPSSWLCIPAYTLGLLARDGLPELGHVRPVPDAGPGVCRPSSGRSRRPPGPRASGCPSSCRRRFGRKEPTGEGASRGRRPRRDPDDGADCGESVPPGVVSGAAWRTVLRRACASLERRWSRGRGYFAGTVGLCPLPGVLGHRRPSGPADTAHERQEHGSRPVRRPRANLHAERWCWTSIR